MARCLILFTSATSTAEEQQPWYCLSVWKHWRGLSLWSLHVLSVSEWVSFCYSVFLQSKWSISQEKCRSLSIIFRGECCGWAHKENALWKCMLHKSDVHRHCKTCTCTVEGEYLTVIPYSKFKKHIFNLFGHFVFWKKLKKEKSVRCSSERLSEGKKSSELFSC